MNHMQPALPVTLAMLALCGPAWLSLESSPSTTFLNQALALIGWAALAVWALTRTEPALRAQRRPFESVTLVLGLLGVAAVGSLAFEHLPSSLTLSACGLIASAALVARMARRAGLGESYRALFTAACVATVLAGLVSVLIAGVQVFAPAWADGNWIDRVSSGGRAGGNLRQPNHLSSLLLAAIAALIGLHATRLAEPSPLRKLRHALTAAAMAALAFGVVLTASRTGTVCIVLLALWGVFDSRLPRFSRWLLGLTPLVYAMCWAGLAAWNANSFAGEAQLHKSDISSSRFAIWSNTLELIKQSPWAGVGWGEFNFAWTLTPFPNRPVAFFDHTHNLPLQLWVELGLPLGTLVLALLGWAFWKAFDNARKAPPDQAVMRSCAFMMVLMMGVHSMLEYPLWYAYFLLPTAFAWGLCLSDPNPPAASSTRATNAKPKRSKWFTAAGLLILVGALYSIYDYQKVVVIFAPPKNAGPLADRIEAGKHSVFFAHHAHYAAATTTTPPSAALDSFKVATHFLLDTRLMMAWANALNESGDVEKARWVAARLREFRNPASADFFAACDKVLAPGEAQPFQCMLPTRQFTYRDFR